MEAENLARIVDRYRLLHNCHDAAPVSRENGARQPLLHAAANRASITKKLPPAALFRIGVARVDVTRHSRALSHFQTPVGGGGDDNERQAPSTHLSLLKDKNAMTPKRR